MITKLIERKYRGIPYWLHVWRTRNQQSRITGVFIYNSGAFMHVLEGEEKAVRVLLKRIRNDDRHEGIQMLHTRYQPEREFQDWVMSFRGDDEGSLPSRIDGYLPPRQDAFANEPYSREAGVIKSALLHFSRLYLD